MDLDPASIHEPDSVEIHLVGTGADPIPELDASFSQRHGVVLRRQRAGHLHVSLREGADPAVVFGIQRDFARPLDLQLLSSEAFDRLTAVPNAQVRGPDPAAPFVLASDHGGSADRLLAAIVDDAVRRGATDVHLVPDAAGMAIRMRVGAMLVEAVHLAPAEAALLAAAVRAATTMEPGTAAKAQTGAIRFAPDSGLPDLIVATLATHAGERMLLRRAPDLAQRDALAALGMAPPLLRHLKRALGRPGMILVTGPAGSGKTTTLHALVRHLVRPTSNILAIEDRLEATLDGVSHIIADPAEGFTVADGLRAILTQDPDIVMIGNIAGRAAARAAMEAVDAGHLVIAGVDAGDAVGAILALRAMKVDPLLLAASLNLVVAQQLVRKLCSECRRPVQAQGSVSALLGFDPGAIVYAADGCSICDGTGYAGETGVFEAIDVDAAIRRLISDGGDAAILARHAFVNAPNLGSAARAMVRDGVTTPDEAVRIARSAGQPNSLVSGPGGSGQTHA